MAADEIRRPRRTINAVAPIRICDNGGWTDTWFADYGKVFNIGVYPYAEVQVEVYPRDGRTDQIAVYAENYGEHFVAHPDQHTWTHHPLLEAVVERMSVPKELAIQVTVFSEAPAGASTGTSAAVTVALIGALDRLTTGRLAPHQVAYAAHAVEVEMLKKQTGIQDQLCAAYGGINFIEMLKYPHASVSQLFVPDTIWWELERRLALVYLGNSHDSSQVHEMVIEHLENAGPTCRQLEDLRLTAEKSRDAVYAGDFAALGRAMIENTRAQTRLHPALVSQTAQRVIDIASRYGAAGWKVNGAGGEGGSITILCSGLSHEKRAMIREIEADAPLCRNIPVYLSRHGLRVWEEECV
ncbi:MAG: GHMP kinase [Chloroflexi bacterium]|nr:GHMP kinase [Chloroflexota bacterium]